MENELQERARLRFDGPGLRGIVTTVGQKTVEFTEEAAHFGLSDKETERLQKVIGLNKRQVVDGDVTTLDLCFASAQNLLQGLGVEASSVQALILVTQTPDYSAPSSAIALQHRLGMPITSMAFDMRLGCSGFVYGLCVASSLVQSGLKRVLVCVGDVASKMVSPSDHAITPLMGDAGAAALVENVGGVSTFEMYSDGSGARALYIPNSGALKVQEDEGKPALMLMDGAAVFNFTLQRVPNLIRDAIDYAGISEDDIDYFVLHQPNRYILHNTQKRLGLSEERLPTKTQSVYGNQNSASIPGTINGFLHERYSSGKVKSVLAGFGIGLSWAACTIETDRLYCPPTRIYKID